MKYAIKIIGLAILVEAGILVLINLPTLLLGTLAFGYFIAVIGLAVIGIGIWALIKLSIEIMNWFERK